MSDKAMTLRQFADMAGVSVILCGPGWGGRYGYVTVKHPNSTHCGFKTAAEAREAWAINTFGEQAARALFALLRSQK